MPQRFRHTVLRDRGGDILRITSPHGHMVSLQNDSQGRITKAQDDAGHWVSYEYDENGALIKQATGAGPRNYSSTTIISTR